MNRRNFLKLSPLASLALLIKPPRARALGGETLHFQPGQDPPVDWHYADAFGGMLGVSGSIATIDLSALDPAMKIVHGFLYLGDNPPTGRGLWKIETRPELLAPFPPGQGFQWVNSHFTAANEIGLQLAARCGNNGRFEIRVTRQDSTNIEWSFAPVWWWS